MRSLLILCALLLPAVAAGQSTVQGGYSTQTLREPIFTGPQVLAESVKLNNWLVNHYGKLSADRMKGPREHLYYLIDSRVKEIYANSKQVMPPGPDPVLAGLFGWAERLGVYGGSQIFNRLRSDKAEAQAPGLPLPQGMSVELRKDMLHVESGTGGWSVDFPYYFMLWRVGDFTASNQQRMQVIAVSTGASKDKGELGHSQATLMLVYAPDAKLDGLMAYFLKQAGIKAEAEQKDVGMNKLRSRYQYNAETKVHSELVGWPTARGALVVMYSGLDGAYQWNRPHFLDFLRAIQTR